ncbi:uncharacterized protein LOC111789933 [Cucurbita pepo subsp. pepo]|uniref:uncharacterized protein LOC111789933 n=1 Tax=Cucurbita pepo subsp. pepo TaxID=3664 RepID=UPI000C9D26BD|nr:uncharacterized protein LOC111789933 [Cucurbita pepo subsp. pepo]
MKMVSLSPSSSSLQIFPSSSSLKALLQTLILSLARAISRAKTTALHILKQANHQSAIAFKRNKNKLLFGSFRLHYNWCSSSNYHVAPPPLTWDDNSAAGAADHLTGYLQWLEHKDKEEELCRHVNEIDKLADIFIARCHEKFRLEKQESYRKFQEMAARSL